MKTYYFLPLGALIFFISVQTDSQELAQWELDDYNEQKYGVEATLFDPRDGVYLDLLQKQVFQTYIKINPKIGLQQIPKLENLLKKYSGRNSDARIFLNAILSIDPKNKTAISILEKLAVDPDSPHPNELAKWLLDYDGSNKIGLDVATNIFFSQGEEFEDLYRIEAIQIIYDHDKKKAITMVTDSIENKGVNIDFRFMLINYIGSLPEYKDYAAKYYLAIIEDKDESLDSKFTAASRLLLLEPDNESASSEIFSIFESKKGIPRIFIESQFFSDIGKSHVLLKAIFDNEKIDEKIRVHAGAQLIRYEENESNEFNEVWKLIHSIEKTDNSWVRPLLNTICEYEVNIKRCFSFVKNSIEASSKVATNELYMTKVSDEIKILGKLKNPNAERFLLMLTSHPNSGIRRLAVEEYLNTKKTDKTFEKKLAEFISDHSLSDSLRMDATYKLASIDPRSDIAIKGLVEVVENDTGLDYFGTAGERLLNMDRSNPNVNEAIINISKSLQPGDFLFEELVLLGSKNQRAAEALSQIVKDTEMRSDVRLAAASALKDIDPQSKLLDGLVESYREELKEGYGQSSFISAIAELSKYDSDALEELLNFLDSVHPLYTEEAKDTLVKIGASKTVNKALFEKLSSQNVSSRKKSEISEIILALPLNETTLPTLKYALEQVQDNESKIKIYEIICKNKSIIIDYPAAIASCVLKPSVDIVETYLSLRGPKSIGNLIHMINLNESDFREYLEFHKSHGYIHDLLLAVSEFGNDEFIKASPDIYSKIRQRTENILVVADSSFYLKKDNEKLLSEIGARFDLESRIQELKGESLSGSTLEKIGLFFTIQGAFWITLTTLYPYSKAVRAVFFWNPWVRQILGLGYIGLFLTWVPYLRNRIIQPFRYSLTGAANLRELDNINWYSKFCAVNERSSKSSSLTELILTCHGQIIIEGESGLGKTFWLRQYVKSCKRPVVFLPAEKCKAGVLSAIQNLVIGFASDPQFLDSLIYANAFDICIDGANEVSGDTRHKISSFMERFSKSNILITTQHTSWDLPKLAEVWKIQSLNQDQILDFLTSYNVTELTSGAHAALDQSKFEERCKGFVDRIPDLDFNEEGDFEILSNPMDLNLIAQLIASSVNPNIDKLVDQLYQKVEAKYSELYPGSAFPIEKFSEFCFERRKGESPVFGLADLVKNGLESILDTLLSFKILIKTPSVDSKESVYQMRHDKFRCYFIYRAFLGDNSKRQLEYISYTRFHGVYYYLANNLPFIEASKLRDKIVRHAARSKDNELSNQYVLWLEKRERRESLN